MQFSNAIYVMLYQEMHTKLQKLVTLINLLLSIFVLFLASKSRA